MKWTQAQKIAYFKTHPQNFAGPNMSFPIKDASDVSDAAQLAGHADNPDEVRAKIVEIARRLGFDNALPEAWKEKKSSSKAERAVKPDTEDNNEGKDESDDSDTADKEDAEGDDTSDESGDNLKSDSWLKKAKKSSKSSKAKRGQDEPDILRNVSADVMYYAPITRINREKREVIGTATAEVKDAYRTVIGYEASKDAFGRWRGNIREMHQNKAVGRALEIIPDDENRRIVVRARISKGAEDTWQKILDGTLTGFSIGGHNGKWTTRVIDGEELPYLERYDQAELSVVDNPACPVAAIEVVRADGVASDILAKDDEIATKAKVPSGHVERNGARLSQDTVDAIHDIRNHQMLGAMSAMKTCGCDECLAALNGLDPDNDGDIDAFGGLYDPDGDADDVMAQATGDRAQLAEFSRMIEEKMSATLTPVVQRINALLASDAQRSENPSPDITRRVDDLSAQIDKIYALVTKIADQPADGGPVLHGAGAPVDKRLATQASTVRSQSDADTIQRALAMGFAPPSTLEDQLKAAAALIKH
jgi:Nucleosome binding factor SPN, SPT16 subunit